MNRFPVRSDRRTEEVLGEVVADEREHGHRSHGVGVALHDLSPLHTLSEKCALGPRPVLGQDSLQRLEQTWPLPSFPRGDLDQRLQAHELVEGPAVGDIEPLGLADPRLACGFGPGDLAIDDGDQHRVLVLEVPVEAATARRQTGCLLDLDDGRAGDALAREQLQRPVHDAFTRVVRHSSRKIALA